MAKADTQIRVFNEDAPPLNLQVSLPSPSTEGPGPSIADSASLWSPEAHHRKTQRAKQSKSKARQGKARQAIACEDGRHSHSASPPPRQLGALSAFHFVGLDTIVRLWCRFLIIFCHNFNSGRLAHAKRIWPQGATGHCLGIGHLLALHSRAMQMQRTRDLETGGGNML